MKKSIKFLVLLLCMSFAIHANADKWDGSVATGFASGSGTSSDPYLITKSSEFAYMAERIMKGYSFYDAYIKQVNDIDLSGQALTVSGSFSGHYDGNGNAIVSSSNIFSSISYSGVFHDVRVYSTVLCPITLTSSGYIYNVFRYCEKPYQNTMIGLITNTNSGTISNCFVYRTSGSTGSEDREAYAIAYKNTGYINNCVNDIVNDIISLRYDSYWKSSYLVGNNFGYIQDCYSMGHIVNTNSGTISGSHCLGSVEDYYNANPTGISNCTEERKINTWGMSSMYQNYISNLNSWASSNSTADKTFSSWAAGEIPIVSLVPQTYKITLSDSYFGYQNTIEIEYGTPVGTLPTPEGNAEFEGWYRNGQKVASTAKFQYAVTLNANWIWRITGQPTAESPCVTADDEEHAQYQWKKHANYHSFEDWKSDNYNVGNSTSSKTYNFEANEGAVLSFDYLVESEYYDKFIVKLNGEDILNTSGDSWWAYTDTPDAYKQTFKHTINSTGSYELEFSYVKDATGDAGADMVKVTNAYVCDPAVNVDGANSKMLTQYDLTGSNAYFCQVSYTNNTTVLNSDVIALKLHKVNYVVDGDLYQSVSVRCGDMISALEMPEKSGYIFSGWSGFPENMLMLDEDITVEGTYLVEHDTEISEISNTIYFDNIEAFCGKTIELPIKMKNDIVATGFQFDIELPEGINAVQDEDGFYDITLSTERTTAAKTNTFDSSLMSDGSIRVLAASTRNYAFSGNDGEVCIIKLNVSEDLPAGDYPIFLKNIELTNAQGQTWNVERLKRTITVKDYQLGDANGDGRVSVGDFSAVANHILGTTPEGFNLGAADANQDNNISVGDLSTIATMILTSENSGASKVRAKAPEELCDPNNFIYADPVVISEDGDATIVFNMKNEIAATGFQFNFKLPEGFEVSEDEDGFLDVFLSQIRTTSRKTNTFDCVKWDDGSYRVLAASTKNYEFSGNDGEVVTVHIQRNAEVESGDYELLLTDIELTNASGETFRNSKAVYTITVPSNSNEIALIDGEAYDNPTTTNCDALTFSKTFSATAAGKWNAFYAPMSVNVEDYAGELEFAEIYAFCAMRDTNGDGVVDANDENVLFVYPLTSGLTKPNVPYLIRPKEAKTYIINSADNVLYAAAQGMVEFSTARDKFTVIGLYEPLTVVAGDNNYYVSSTGTLDYRTTGSTTVKANRWVMHRESKEYGGGSGNSPAASSSYRIVAIGEDIDELTAIKMINAANESGVTNVEIYSLDGRKVTNTRNLRNGLYINNGQKIIVK